MREKLMEDAPRADVVVLPCKLGEIVYIIRSCSCYNDPVLSHKSRAKCANKVYVGESLRKHTHCVYVSKTKFDLKHIADFGKTVFLTKEEAEAALAKMYGERKDNE